MIDPFFRWTAALGGTSALSGAALCHWTHIPSASATGDTLSSYITTPSYLFGMLTVFSLSNAMISLEYKHAREHIRSYSRMEFPTCAACCRPWVRVWFPYVGGFPRILTLSSICLYPALLAARIYCVGYGVTVPWLPSHGTGAWFVESLIHGCGLGTLLYALCNFRLW